MKTLEQLQQEIGAWAKLNFGENVSKDSESVSYGSPLGSIPSLLGMQEELGELSRVVCRLHQGRYKGTKLEAYTAMADALADLLVFGCDFSSREGINLLMVLNLVWEKVQKRSQKTWHEDKGKETPIVLDGHGFGHHPDAPT